MKKALIVVAAIALLLWVVSWFRTPEAVATSGAQAWPGGMGSLDSVAAKFTARPANAASANLMKLGSALPKSEALDAYVGREIARGEIAIGESPAVPDVAAMRELLLREPIVWERPGGVAEVGDPGTSGRRVVQMTIARTLVASALAKARANDAAAWDDLHAVWNLARSLEGQPQMMEQTAALAMARMVNGVAWKLPLPAPDWFAEVQQRDFVQPLLAAFQYLAAAYWEDGAQMFPTKWLADSAEHDRRIAVQMFKTTTCDVNAPMNQLGTDLSFVWRRAFRYRAEREATANAIRLREGKPIEAKSICSDGAWTSDATTLRFNREIPTTAPDTPLPLVLRVKS
jgi:hypothetical protein